MVQLYFRTNGRDRCFVALGSNIPAGGKSTREIVVSARSRLDDEGIEVIKSSRLYESPAFPPGTGDAYVNAVVEVAAESDATELLQRLHGIEKSFGRTRKSRWGARILDLDLLALGDAVLPDVDTYTTWRTLSLKDQRSRVPDGVILPHPRLQDRAFVLVPLAEIAPDWVHPVLGQSAEALRDALPEDDLAAIRPIGV